MQFKDAAYEILKEADGPLHYKEIAKRAMVARILDTGGKTPDASMGSLLYTDTIRPNSRFQRGDKRGFFALKTMASPSIQQQFEKIQIQIRKDLRNQLLSMPPQKFEELIRLLLEQMGFEETETTPYQKDQGVDVRGVLRSNPLSVVKVAVQAKRWKNNVGAGVVRDLRGSLRHAKQEQGLIITPSDFSSGAKSDAQAEEKIPIQLINGLQLVELLIENNVGVKKEVYEIPSIDSEYWSEVLGITLGGEELLVNNENKEHVAKEESKALSPVYFPLSIQGIYKAQVYDALLMDVDGKIRWNGQNFETPSAAAKAVAIGWKSVNGWDFWRYLDPKSGKHEKIARLRVISKPLSK